MEWPAGWPRTNPEDRQHSRFGEKSFSSYGMKPVSMSKARVTLLAELERLGASSVVLSTNKELRLDGLPRAGRRTPEDVGVAVYFILDGRDQCIPCDKWRRVEDNLWAITKTIEALRGIERWGAKEMVNAAFSGFKALPSPDDVVINYIQYFADCPTKAHAKERYRKLAKELHPDQGGDGSAFQEMKRQYEQLR